MIKVFGRVSIEFEVNEELFKTNPEKAIIEAVENGRALYDGGDSYLPEPWNEDYINKDIEFTFKGEPVLRYKDGETK